MFKKLISFVKTTFKKTPITKNTIETPIVEIQTVTSDPIDYAVVEEKKKRGRKKKEENIQ